MTVESEAAASESSVSLEGERPLFVTPVAARRLGARKPPNYLLIVGGGVVAILAAAIAFLALAPQTGALDALNGAVPSLSEGKNCLRGGDVACAEGDFRAYLRKYPNDASASAILAITLTQDGKHKEALPYYKKAMALGVGTYDFYANYAVSLNTVGQVDEAIKMNYAALRIVPSLVDVRGSLADELVRKGKTQEALALLDTFDRSLEDQGQSPYFESQINQIKSRTGGSVAADPRVLNPGAPAAAPGVLNIPLQVGRGALYAPVLVNDAMTLRFVVDSGATDVSIPADVAQVLVRMGKLGSKDYLGQGVFVMADGSRTPAQLVMIRSMRIGDHEVKNVVASIAPPHGPLLLGQSFLKHFKSWSIDNRNRILRLEG